MAKTRSEPRQQRSRQTYERILTVASTVFADLGYAGTTTNKVADAAGISIGTLYHYFPDKDALLSALAERHIADSLASHTAMFETMTATDQDLEETVRTAAEGLVALHIRDRHLHNLLYDSAPRTPQLLRQLREADDAIADQVALQFERLGVVTEHRRLVSQLVVSGMEAQVHHAVGSADAGREAVNPQVLTDLLTRMWTRALNSG